MIDTVVVGLIVAAAVAFLVYRYFYKKSGGCSCGTGSCRQSKNNAKPSSGCQK